MATTTSPYNPKARVACGRLTAAQVYANSMAGTVIVKARSGVTIKVTDCWFRAIGGNAAGATAIVLEDTSGTDVNSQTVAQLTENTVVRAGATGSTCTNLGVALGKHKGLRVGCTVGNLSGASHLDYYVEYVIAN